jgi:hypothetical protein
LVSGTFYFLFILLVVSTTLGLAFKAQKLKVGFKFRIDEDFLGWVGSERR